MSSKRVFTKKQGRVYDRQVITITKGGELLTLTELQPCRENLNLVYRPRTDNYLEISNRTREVKYHGQAKKMMEDAKELTGYTWQLDDLFKLHGFRNTYKDGIWKAREKKPKFA